MEENIKFHREIIFGTTKQRAEEKLSTIKLEEDEKIIMRNKDFIRTNKREIRAVTGSFCSRGYRCTHAFVDILFSIQFLHEVVYPVVMSSSYYGIDKPVRERIGFFGYEY